MLKLHKLFVLFVVVFLFVSLTGCGGGDDGVSLGCKVTCSDVDDVAACESKCEELLHSKDALDTALDVDSE